MSLKSKSSLGAPSELPCSPERKRRPAAAHTSVLPSRSAHSQSGNESRPRSGFPVRVHPSNILCPDRHSPPHEHTCAESSLSGAVFRTRSKCSTGSLSARLSRSSYLAGAGGNTRWDIHRRTGLWVENACRALVDSSTEPLAERELVGLPAPKNGAYRLGGAAPEDHADRRLRCEQRVQAGWKAITQTARSIINKRFRFFTIYAPRLHQRGLEATPVRHSAVRV
jgi:hypothetical protein